MLDGRSRGICTISIPKCSKTKKFAISTIKEGVKMWQLKNLHLATLMTVVPGRDGYGTLSIE